MSERRMGDVLYHRGIQGVLVAAHMESSNEPSEIDWSRLSAVKVGFYPRAPALHRVSHDCSGMMRTAIRQAVAAGYERVGLFMAQWWDDASDRSWSTGFLIEQNNVPSSRRIPILRSACNHKEWVSGLSSRHSVIDQTALAKWYEAYRPDVILGFSPKALAKVGSLGLSVPEDVAYVDVCLECSNDGIAGVRQNGEIAGEVATAMLVAQIQQNLFGAPTVATSTMVEGTWSDGASMPAARGPRTCAEKVDNRVHLGEGALLASSP
jgi:LacI family transcriptional regulator